MTVEQVELADAHELLLLLHISTMRHDELDKAAFDSKPALQSQRCTPGPVCWHTVVAESHPPFAARQGFTDSHSTPLPVKPAMHVHVRWLAVTSGLHKACESQPPLLLRHAEMGVHPPATSALPSYPWLHVH